ncbi:type IV secretion system protein TraC [Chlamydiales bacterium]|nr:type IV secretion system protein TraC [Chlamydiales bacterium]
MLSRLISLSESLASLFGSENDGVKPNSPSLEKKIKDSYFDLETLQTLLPYESYDPKTGLFIQKNSIGFSLQLIPLVGIDEKIQTEINGIFEELLEEGSSIQCMMLADHKRGHILKNWAKNKRSYGKIYETLAHKRSDHLLNGDVVTIRDFLCIMSYSESIKGGNLEEQIQHIQAKRDRMLNMVNSFTYAFNLTVTGLIRLTKDLLYFDFNPHKDSTKWDPLSSLPSQIASSKGKMTVEKSGIHIDAEEEVRFKSFRATDVPENWSTYQMEGLIGDFYRETYKIKAPFYINFSVYMPSQEKEENRFIKNSTMKEHYGKSPTILKMIPGMQEELNELQMVRNRMEKGAKFVWSSFTVGLWARDKEFASYEETLKSLYRINRFRISETKYTHLPHLLSALPMAFTEYSHDMKGLNVLRTTLTDECSSLMPIMGEWVGSGSEGMCLVGRRGQLAFWSPFKQSSGNYNCIVSGKSGKGKSLFMQDLMTSGLGSGARVFVLDVGRSFQRLCELLGGQILDFSHQFQVCLNPFTKIPNDPEEVNNAISDLKSIISSMSAPTEGTTDYENSLIEKAIRNVWKAKKNKATISDVASELLSQDEPEARKIGTMLHPFTKEGIYSRYFEGENNVDFSNPFVLIELEELKGKKDLQSAVVQILIMTITNTVYMGDRKTPFYICIDEAWDLLRAKQTGPFIEGLARRLRKYLGSLVIGTQNIDDFFKTPGAKAAFENSDWQLMLYQDPSSYSELERLGGIDESKKRVLSSVDTVPGKYSEIMISSTGGGYAVVRLVVDPFSYFLYSTTPQEYSRFKDLKEKGYTSVNAIEKMIQEKN